MVERSFDLTIDSFENPRSTVAVVTGSVTAVQHFVQQRQLSVRLWYLLVVVGLDCQQVNGVVVCSDELMAQSPLAGSGSSIWIELIGTRYAAYSCCSPSSVQK